MIDGNPRSRANIFGLPIHAMLVPIPAVCFIGTFFTDLAYAKTANMQWANMSAWLLIVGLVVSVFAVIAGLIDFIGEPRIRALRAAWIHVAGNAIVIVLSIVNALVHSRDAYTSVVPTGLILSAIVAIILVITALNGLAMVHRHRVGVAPKADR